MGKQAILAVGISERDISALTKQIIAQCEAISGGRWVMILEKDIICEFVTSNQLNPLCLTSWIAPIKNDCILKLLERTEAAAEDERVAGIVIGGSFTLDDDVRSIYEDILTEQGFEVGRRVIESSWMSTMFDCLESGAMPLPKLVELWDKYNKSFVRQYNPTEPKPTAVIVSKEYAYDNEPINTMIKAAIEEIILLRTKNSKYDFRALITGLLLAFFIM